MTVRPRILLHFFIFYFTSLEFLYIEKSECSFPFFIFIFPILHILEAIWEYQISKFEVFALILELDFQIIYNFSP